jgi:ATP-dependent Clp endopeptidase proteolytic subunit ClpP
MTQNKKDDFGIELPQFSPFELILAEARYILLYEEIDEITAREINTKLIAMSIKDPRKPILLEICSGGGSVGHGIAIMNTIRTIPSSVITYINGEACSMAGIISVVGDKRIIAPNSYWMGHSMTDGLHGTPQTIKDRAKYLDGLENELRVIFQEKTKFTEDDFQKMIKGELWLSPQESLTKGVADEIKSILTPRPARKRKAKK